MLAGGDVVAWLRLVGVALAVASDGGAPAGGAADAGVAGRSSLPFSLSPAARAPAPAPAASFPLERQPDGGYRYQGPRFLATIAPDGVVAFVDHKPAVVEFQFALMPKPLPAGTASLEGSVRDLLTGRRRAKPPPAQVVPERPHPSAPLYTHDIGGRPLGYPNHGLPLVLADVKADVLAQYLGLMADERAADDKAQFLTATFDMRAEMAARVQAARVRGSRAEMRRLLARLWADRSRPPIERRRLICALWAELDPTSAAGAEGRAGLLAFVTERLPAGDPQAFSEAEIAACPRAADGARFAPYPGAVRSSAGAPPGGSPAAGSSPPPPRR
jgi:hypothetical protein